MKAFKTIGIASAVMMALLALGCRTQTGETHDAALTTEIYQAACKGDVGKVKALLEAHPELVNSDISGWTPLHDSAHSGRKELAELLLAKGADINANKNVLGWTPLHHAAACGHKEVVEVLLAKGADANAKDNKGKTPLRIALGNNQKAVADLLRQHGGKE